jgi:superfamily II DNA/RNA helicase
MIACATCRFSEPVCALAGGGWELQARALQRPIDLLVGTPQRVLQHAAKGNLAFGDVRWIVLDEADTMFDTGG